MLVILQSGWTKGTIAKWLQEFTEGFFFVIYGLKVQFCWYIPFAFKALAMIKIIVLPQWYCLWDN